MREPEKEGEEGWFSLSSRASIGRVKFTSQPNDLQEVNTVCTVLVEARVRGCLSARQYPVCVCVCVCVEGHTSVETQTSCSPLQVLLCYTQSLALSFSFLCLSPTCIPVLLKLEGHTQLWAGKRPAV